MSVLLDLSNDAERDRFAGLPALIFSKDKKKNKGAEAPLSLTKISNIMFSHIFFCVECVDVNSTII